MAVYQTARFCINPELIHNQILKVSVAIYSTQEKKESFFSPEKSKGLEYYADADFAGGWQQADSDDANNVISRTSFIITYVNCPVFLSSKLQTEIVLSTAGYEYIALSSALR